MKYLLSVISTFLLCGSVHAAAPIFDENQNDNELLEPFLFHNRAEMAASNAIGLSGDVRVTARTEEVKDGQDIEIGKLPDGAFVVNTFNNRVYTYKVEANIFLDHRCGCWWTSVKLSAANNLAVSAGTYDKLSLKRALIGYDIFKRGPARLYGEIGRQFLSDKFDSEVMFGSPLDGGFFHYCTRLARAGDFFLQGAFLVVDSVKGQYGWIASAGWEDIFCTGLFAKYVVIDWGKDREYTLRIRQKFTNEEGDPYTKESKAGAKFRPSYLTSQVLVGYKWCWCGKEMKVFGAYLRNHDAHSLDRSLRRDGVRVVGLRHEADAAYVGIEVGKVRKCGDLALKFEMQYVEAFAFPEFDNNGIGNNVGSNNGLFNLKTLGNGKAIVISDTRSPLNYWGPKLEIAYAFTDDVSGRFQYMQSWSIKRFFGFKRRYQRFEAKLIYSF